MFKTSFVFSTYLAAQISSFPYLTAPAELIGGWGRFDNGLTFEINSDAIVALKFENLTLKGSIVQCGTDSAKLCIGGFYHFSPWQCYYDVVFSSSQQSAFFILVKGSDRCSASGMFEKRGKNLN